MTALERKELTAAVLDLEYIAGNMLMDCPVAVERIADNAARIRALLPPTTEPLEKLADEIALFAKAEASMKRMTCHQYDTLNRWVDQLRATSAPEEPR